MVISSRRLPRLIAAGAALGLAALGVHPADASNDPLSDRQWSLTQAEGANVPAAWPTTTGGRIRIGIVDSGVNRNHDDLKDRVVASATCVGTGGDQAKCDPGSGAGNDVAGHGTHVAGIAAATMGNNTGVAGVAPGAQLVVARVFRDNGSDDPSAELNDVKAGIEWVVANGAKVVNLSLGVSGGLLGGFVGGGSNEGSPLGAAVQAAWDAGAIPVIAAGNENGSLFGADGSYGDLDAIVVGATIRNGSVAGYSNGLTRGTKWGMVAPGGDSNGVDKDMILSTFTRGNCQPSNSPSCYAYLSGTSMAAPMVSGAAALLLSQGLSREQAVQTLLDTADKVSCGEGCQGRLNVGRAVAKNASVNNNGGGTSSSGGGQTTTPGSPTTGRRRSTATTSAPGSAPGSAPTAPTPAEIVVPSEPTHLEFPTTRKPRQAIVLNSGTSDDSGIPAAAGAAGVGLLAVALAGTGISLRRVRGTVSS
ncbi:MAG: S8 family serine peptidase [Actinobacteria bacterium]|nr:S8 family serine peptidase [Actinomycetota bacterium]